MVQTEIKNLLIKLEVTPEQFGENIGVGKSTVYKLLRGDTKKITTGFAKKINAFYKEITIESLLSYNFNSEIENDTKSNTVREDQLKYTTGLDQFSKDQIAVYLINNHEEFTKSKTYQLYKKDVILQEAILIADEQIAIAIDRIKAESK